MMRSAVIRNQQETISIVSVNIFGKNATTF